MSAGSLSLSLSEEEEAERVIGCTARDPGRRLRGDLGRAAVTSSEAITRLEK